MTEPAAKREVAVVLASSRVKGVGRRETPVIPAAFLCCRSYLAAVFQKRMIIDDFLLDRVFQPIGDWSHQQLGIHPQTIAEFFGVGAIVTEIGDQFLLNLELRFIPLAIVSGCLAVGIPTLWYWVIKRPMRSAGGRNPKRYRYAPVRMIYALFTLLSIAEVGLIKHNMLAHAMSAASFGCIWLGVTFASLDEPAPRKQRRSVWGWAS